MLQFRDSWYPKKYRRPSMLIFRFAFIFCIQQKHNHYIILSNNKHLYIEVPEYTNTHLTANSI